MLELKNISFEADGDDGIVEIVRDVSLTIPDNRFVVITGPNGGGKSTLAKLIAGIEWVSVSRFSSLYASRVLRCLICFV